MLQTEVVNVNSLLVDLKAAAETHLKQIDALALALEKERLDAQVQEDEFISFRSKAETERQTILRVCKEECDSLTTKLNEAREEVEKAKEETQTLAVRLERSHNQQSAMLDDLQVMEQEVKSLESVRKNLNAELQARIQKIQVLEEQLTTENEDSAEELKQRLSHLVRKNKDTEALLHSLASEKNEDFEDAKKEISQLRKEIKAEKKEKQRLQLLCERLTAEAAGLKTQLEEIETYTAATKAKITQELTSRIMQLEGEKMELKQTLQEARDEAEISRKSIFYGQPSLLDELKMDRPSIRWSRASIALKPQSDPQLELLKSQLVIATLV